MWRSTSLCMWGQKKRSRFRWTVRSTPRWPISSCSSLRMGDNTLEAQPVVFELLLWVAFSLANTYNLLWASFILGHCCCATWWFTCFSGISSSWAALSAWGAICFAALIRSLLSSAMAVVMVTVHSNGSLSTWWTDNPLETMDKISACICCEQVSTLCQGAFLIARLRQN